MIDVEYRGRLGNRLIQYAAAYLLADRTGIVLKAQPAYRDQQLEYFDSAFNIKPIAGKTFDKIVPINDKGNKFYYLLNNPTSNTGYLIRGYFQDERLLCDYRDYILNLYKDQNPQTTNPKDAFIHARLGDVLQKEHLLPYFQASYLQKQLEKYRSSLNTVYVSSDTITHPPLKNLINEYDLTIYEDSPFKTILFAKDFNNLFLSAGSFSYWIAYLSSAKSIIIFDRPQDPLRIGNAWRYNENVKFDI